MDLRLRSPATIDDRAVPLPHGTEVITRVERAHGERRVPQGTVGRVQKIAGESIDVAIVGVGTLRYDRAELTPRRVGQAVFARRREAAWSALEGCVVLRTVVGSRAWGLSDEGSDTDERGVFALPLPWTTGLVAPPEDLVSSDGSAHFWLASKAVQQALRADPNTLETLFVDGARATDEIGAWILEAREAFVSTEIHGTFGRYAVSQLRRLEQSARLAEHRGHVLGWLAREPELSLDALADRLAAIAPRAFPTRADAILQSKQWVKQLYRSLFDQGLLASNDLAGLVHFAQSGARDLDLPRELRPKNAYNLLRLIDAAAHWLRDGAPKFRTEGAFRDRLLAIKRGDVALDDVLTEAEGMLPALEEAKRASPLPPRPDVARIDDLLRRIGEEVARRWIERAPGPLGREAPAPPAAEWDDGSR